MAKISFNGMDAISASFEELANVTDDDRKYVLQAGARVFAERQIAQIKTWFTQRSGQLANSVAVQLRGSDDSLCARIFFKGKRKDSDEKERRQRKLRRSRSDDNLGETNTEVAYILNYGSSRIKATHWLEYANEDVEPEAMDAMKYAWDEVLESKGL